MSQKIKVQNEEKERIDQFLSRFLDISRSKIQKLIKAKQVLVKGVIATAHTPVNDGDEVELLADPDPEIPNAPTPPLPEILYEDDDVVVINKAAGLKVHRSNETDKDGNLTQALLERWPQMATVGDDPDVRPGLVHRIDKTASGALIVAKTQEAFEFLKEQFQARNVRKIYTVLVYGSVSKDHEFIKFRLERNQKSGMIVAHPEESERGRDAISEFDVVERFATTTLLKVQIHTGRTHQIRVHFYSIGHPVVGDNLYKKTKRKINPIKIDSLFLHATELTITLPNGEEKTFIAPLPENLQTILGKLSK
ncbi:MAG: RluA family pseudouridine synthase [bacterium]|nr:RluA family pseudouridine synthase [bacterium]